MNIEKEYEQHIISHFNSFKDDLKRELGKVIKEISNKPIAFLYLEYDSSNFDEAFPFCIMGFDNRGKLIDDVCWILDDSDHTVALSSIYNNKKYDNIEPWEVASKLFEKFIFEMCSNEKLINKPAFIGNHDSYFKLDLSTGNIINWDEILEKMRG